MLDPVADSSSSLTEFSGNADQNANAYWIVLQEALRYTEGQIEDLLALRQLFWRNCGRLDRKRKAMLDEIGDSGSSLPEFSRNADAMQSLVTEEFDMHLQLAVALYFGVRTIP